jgi:O-antigen ligase
MIGSPASSELRGLFRDRSSAAVPVVARHRFGFLFVLSVPIVAILADAPGFNIAGFHMTGWVWVASGLVGMLMLLLERAVHHADKIAFPYLPWLIWFGYVWASLIWTQHPERFQVQQASQLTMPLLMGVLASIFVRSKKQLELLLRTYCYVLLLGCLIVVLAKTHRLPLADMNNLEDPLGTMAPFGMMVALISSVFLVRFWRKPTVAFLGWGTGLMLSFASGARTVTATMILLPILNPAIKRTRTRIVLAAAAGSLGLALFCTPWFQSRFFYSGSGTLSDLFSGEFDTSGRFDAWPWYWDEAWRHPILGKGVGTVVTLSKFAWGDGATVQVHNDYLAMGFELGLVGLSLFSAVFVGQFVGLWLGMKKTDGITRDAFAIGMLGMIVLALNACTDNPLAYNLWFMDPLFVLIGAAYGVRNATATETAEHSAGVLRPALLQAGRQFSLN